MSRCISLPSRLLAAFAVAELYRVAGKEELVEFSSGSAENVRATLKGCQVVLMSFTVAMNLMALVVIILQAHHTSRLLAYGLVGSANLYMDETKLMRHFSLRCIVFNLPIYTIGVLPRTHYAHTVRPTHTFARSACEQLPHLP